MQSMSSEPEAEPPGNLPRKLRRKRRPAPSPRHLVPVRAAICFTGCSAALAIALRQGATGLVALVGIPLLAGVLAAWTAPRTGPMFSELRCFLTWILFTLGTMLLLQLLQIPRSFMSLDVRSGLFCTLFMPPIAIPGFAIGFALGRSCWRADRPAETLKSWVILCVLPLGALEQLQPDPAPREHAISVVLQGTPDELWSTSIFTGETMPVPPLAAHLGLTRPHAATGHATQVGETKRIDYRDGHVTLRVEESAAPHRLVVRCIEQVKVEDRGARFETLTLQFEPGTTPETTRFTATLVWTPLLECRLLTAPLERLTVEAALHELTERLQANALPNRP